MNQGRNGNAVGSHHGHGKLPAFRDLPLEARTIGRVVRDAASRFGSKPFVVYGDHTVSYEEASLRANQAANALAGLGIGKGSRVAILSANRLEYLDLWFGLALLGAIQVPLNTAYRAAQIAHTLRRSRVEAAVVQAQFAAEFLAAAADLPDLKHVIPLDGDVPATGNARTIAYEHIVSQASRATPAVEVTGTEVGAIMNTSGTTGPAKGVLLPQSQQYWLGRNMALALELGPDDVYYNFFPLFHNTAQAMITLPVLLTGGRMVLTEKFSLSSFWPDVQAHGVTAFYYIGEILNLLVKAGEEAAPPRGATRLRAAWGIGGAPADVAAFTSRHGVAMGTGYGSTEANVPIFRPLGATPDSASCGRTLPEFEVSIVDPQGRPVPAGGTGEIAVRSREPGTMLAGYDGDEEATGKAMHGGWFHTGDAGRFDAEGNFYFVSRLKDVIRVRGENVSAFEIEAVLLDFPGVVEASAIAVPGELGGDDVKAVIVVSDDIALDALIAHCGARLPKFSLPRYVEVVEELPKTATNKIQKHILRASGINATSWDSKSCSFVGQAAARRDRIVGVGSRRETTGQA